MTLDFVFKTMTGHDTNYWLERGDLDWYNSYADLRLDSGKGILTANWNHFPRAGAADSHRTEQGKTDQDFNWSRKSRRFQAILEEMGYQLEWNDQTSRCDHCYGCITEGPDYYGDSAHYAILKDSDIVCEDCIRKDFSKEYLEGLEGNPRAASFIAGVDPSEHGYILIQDGFENGFHPGQNDNPTKIMKALKDKGYEHLIFQITDAGQFDVHFAIWHKPPFTCDWCGSERTDVEAGEVCCHA